MILVLSIIIILVTRQLSVALSESDRRAVPLLQLAQTLNDEHAHVPLGGSLCLLADGAVAHTQGSRSRLKAMVGRYAVVRDSVSHNNLLLT